MPPFNADYFGATNVGKIYGLMITAWGFGGVLGPILISRVIDTTESYTAASYIIAGILLVSAILPFIVRPPRAPEDERTATTPESDQAPAAGSGG